MIKNTTFRNAKVRYTDKGKGRVIVLLHGFLESIEVWDVFSNALSGRYRVVAIDLPGHGGTECIGYVHSMELMAETVKAVLNHLGLRRYVLVGHSMGGYVCLAFAELYPDNLKGLVLFHSTALEDSDEKKKDRVKAIKTLKKGQPEFISKLIIKLFAHSNISRMQKEIQMVKSIAEKTSKQGVIAGLEGMKERKNREIILKFGPFPILFILGKKDQVIPWKSLLSQMNLPRDKEILFLENAGHMGFYEESAETLLAIEKFAKRN